MKKLMVVFAVTVLAIDTFSTPVEAEACLFYRCGYCVRDRSAPRAQVNTPKPAVEKPVVRPEPAKTNVRSTTAATTRAPVVKDDAPRSSATPVYWHTSCACGSVWKEKGDFDRALADCNEVIRLDPGYAAAYANRGEIWRLKGDLDHALADQDQAIQLSPANLVYYVFRGDILRYRGDLKGALAAYEQALRLDPDYVPALYGRGRTYEKMGDLARARVEFEKAVASKSKWAALEGAKSAQESARARLAALASGAPQPVIPAAPAKAENPTSIPTPAVSAPVLASAVPDQGRRVALVIGNAAYKNIKKLANPLHDAEVVAATLRGLGFAKVTVIADATRERLLEALTIFANEVEKSDWAMVYYAGHGIEVGGMNYLVPVDAKLEADRDVYVDAVSLDQVMAAIGQANKLKLVLLDACRDNPFIAQTSRTASAQAVTRTDVPGPTMTTRTVGRGLAEVTVRGATLVVFAARHGQTTLDGEGDNSPFTVAFVQRIAMPGVEINKLFRLVRDDVIEATAGRQEPFTYGSLPGGEDFFFAQK